MIKFLLKLIKNTTFRIIVLVIFVIMGVLAFAFRDKIQVQFDHAIAFYKVYRGDVSYRKGNLQKAISKYNEALKLYPEHANARYNLGNIYVSYEDYESAVQCYEEAIKHKPKFLNARLNLGLVLSEQLLRYERAIDEYADAIENVPFVFKIPYVYDNSEHITSGKAIAYYNMGLSYKGLSLLHADEAGASRYNLQKAVESYRKSNKIISDNYETNYNLGLTLHLLGRMTEAKESYCKAINISPLSYEAHYNMALLLREQNNLVDAITELEKAGLILDAKGNSFITSYIYDVLNEVNSRIHASSGYRVMMEKINKDPVNNVKMTYVNGKVVATDDFDKAIIENFKQCNACDYEE